MAEIIDDNQVVIAATLADVGVNFGLLRRFQGLIVHMIDFKHLAHMASIDIAHFTDGRGIRPNNGVQADIGFDPLLQGAAMGVVANNGQQIHMIAQRRRMIGRGDGTASKNLR